MQIFLNSAETQTIEEQKSVQYSMQTDGKDGANCIFL